MVNEERDAIFTIAEHTLRNGFDDLPSDAVDAVKRQLTDTFGVALAGASAPGARQLREFTVEMGGRPESRIWGTDSRVPAQDAARVNATMSHSLDYDDDHEVGFIHPAAITVPSALAVADLTGGVAGKELIAAIALGVDVSCRLAVASRPGTPPMSYGWHSTSVLGYFSSTLVAGKLLGLTPDELVAALGIAFHQAAGNSQAHLDGALTKRMGPGFASYAGVLAARLAKRGVYGARHVLEGARGFFWQYHHGDYSRETLLDGLGTDYAGPEVAFKPWPSCRGTHTAIEAALTLFADENVQPDDVDEITIFSGPAEYDLLASPLALKQRPGSIVDAQFSNPWVVAAALVDRRVSLEHFTPAAIARADLLAVTRRIRTERDDSLARPGGGTGATRLRLRLRDGRELDRTVAFAKGEPNNPMNSEELRAKFFDCTAVAGLAPGAAEALLAEIDALESMPDSAALTDAMRIETSRR